jgi:hypothetical protein
VLLGVGEGSVKVGSVFEGEHGWVKYYSCDVKIIHNQTSGCFQLTPPICGCCGEDQAGFSGEGRGV